MSVDCKKTQLSEFVERAQNISENILRHIAKSGCHVRRDFIGTMLTVADLPDAAGRGVERVHLARDAVEDDRLTIQGPSDEVRARFQHLPRKYFSVAPFGI